MTGPRTRVGDNHTKRYLVQGFLDERGVQTWMNTQASKGYRLQSIQRNEAQEWIVVMEKKL